MIFMISFISRLTVIDLYLSHYRGRVMAPKPANRPATDMVWIWPLQGIVQITFGSGFSRFKVGGDIVVQRQHGCNQLNCTGAPSICPVAAFIELTLSLGVLPENRLDGFGFHHIIQISTGTVSIDVINLFRLIPASARAFLKARAAPFPSGSGCTT